MKLQFLDEKHSKFPEKEREGGTIGDVAQVVQKRREIDCEDLEMETETESFKMPHKRKMSDKSQNKKALKKLDLNFSDDYETETESESEFSDSSVVLSQNEFSARSYNAEEVKVFLKLTKNKRGVCVQEYFPNLTQFVEKTKSLMAEGCFTNKEVYRLKKIVRNLEKIKNYV